MHSTGPAGGDLLSRRYRLIDRVGAGGMSVVWRARDEVLDRLVAVKWLGAELADDSLFRDLVRREAWATARVRHPAVATVHDYGEVNDVTGQTHAYVVMELLDGESLGDRLLRGPLPWSQAVTISAVVAAALARAHAEGVVHRDVSPDNVMLTGSGPRLFDFGIAAPVGEPDDDATGATFGTPAYVAPERLDGRPAQTATDVYALGVLLFEMLTGAPPFPQDTWDPTAPLRLRTAPYPQVSGLPRPVGRLCRRCLAHDPADRPTAEQVAARLARYGLATDGQGLGEKGLGRRGWAGRGPGGRFGRRLALITAGAAAAAAVGLLVAVALLLSGLVTAARPDHHQADAGADPGVRPTIGGGPSAGGSATGAGPTGVGGPGAGVGPSGSRTTGGDRSPGAGTGPSGGSGATRLPSPTAAPSAPPLPTVRQALAGLTDTITAAVPTGMDADIGQDLRNSVDGVAALIAASPGADVRQPVIALQQKINTRSAEQDQTGRPRMSASTHRLLLARLDELVTALGYPPLPRTM